MAMMTAHEREDGTQAPSQTTRVNATSREALYAFFDQSGFVAATKLAMTPALGALLTTHGLNVEQARRQLFNWKKTRGLVVSLDKLTPDKVLRELNARAETFETLATKALTILRSGSLKHRPHRVRLVEAVFIESNYTALEAVTTTRLAKALAECAPDSTHVMTASALRFEVMMAREQKTVLLDAWRRLAAAHAGSSDRHEVALVGIHVHEALRKAWQNSIHESELIMPDDDRGVDPVVRSRVYYIAGWCLSRIRVRAEKANSPTLKALYVANLRSDAERERGLLPDDEVAAQTRGSLVFPGRFFYEFILLVEACHASALTFENVLSHGVNEVVAQLGAALVKHPPVLERWAMKCLCITL
ncbi:hypothetical protein RI054_13g64510 [Pseudoscourfieldia marina]